MAIHRRVYYDAQIEFDTKKKADENDTEKSSATFESLTETLMSLSDKIEKSNGAIDKMKIQNMQDSRQGPSSRNNKKKTVTVKGKRQ